MPGPFANWVVLIGAVLLIVLLLIGGFLLVPIPSEERAKRVAAARAEVAPASESTELEPVPAAPASVEEIPVPPDVPAPDPKAPPEDLSQRPELPGVALSAGEGADQGTAQSLGEAIPTPPPVPESLLSPQLPGLSRPGPGRADLPKVATLQDRFLFNNLSPEAVAAQPLVFADAKAESFSLPNFAPQGEMIELALVADASSSDTEVDVIAAVWEPFIFQGRTLLNVGDRILGKAAPGKKRDRMQVQFYKVIFPDGRSLGLQAVGMEIDGTLGLRGEVVGSQLLQGLAPVVLDMAAAFSDSFKDRVLVGSGTPQQGFQNASGGIQDVPNARNAAISAGQSGLQTISQLVAQEVEENRPYVLLRRGSRCRAYLTSPLDTSLRDYGR